MTQPGPPGASVGAGQQVETAPIYGEGFAAVYRTSRYAVFSQRMARLALALIERHGAPGRMLLDLACGAGAGSVVFAGAGYEVTAVDASPVMIRCAEERARGKGVDVRLQQQDMQSLALPYQVDVVTCLFDALNYILHEEELGQVFANIARVLQQGGLFVFDMNTPHGLATRWGTKDVVSTNRGDVFEVNQNRYNADSSVNTTTTTVFVRDDNSELFRRYTEVHRERGYPAKTIERLLTQAGLAVLSIEALTDAEQGMIGRLTALTDDAGRIVITARRSNAGADGGAAAGHSARRSMTAGCG